MITSIDAEKAFNKVWHPFMILKKNTQQSRNTGSIPQNNKAIYMRNLLPTSYLIGKN